MAKKSRKNVSTAYEGTGQREREAAKFGNVGRKEGWKEEKERTSSPPRPKPPPLSGCPSRASQSPSLPVAVPFQSRTLGSPVRVRASVSRKSIGENSGRERRKERRGKGTRTRTHPERPTRLDHVQTRLALALALDDGIGPLDRDGRVPPGDDGAETEGTNGRVEGVGLEVEGETLGEDLRVKSGQRFGGREKGGGNEREGGP